MGRQAGQHHRKEKHARQINAVLNLGNKEKNKILMAGSLTSLGGLLDIFLELFTECLSVLLYVCMCVGSQTKQGCWNAAGAADFCWLADSGVPVPNPGGRKTTKRRIRLALEPQIFSPPPPLLSVLAPRRLLGRSLIWQHSHPPLNWSISLYLLWFHKRETSEAALKAAARWHNDAHIPLFSVFCLTSCSLPKWC